MGQADEQGIPVKVKAMLIDPKSMTVSWMNEAASEDMPAEDRAGVPGAPVVAAVPLADVLGVPEALRAVAETGVARHLKADLVSTSRGSIAIVTSVYSLPDGVLLLLMEHAWQVRHERGGEDSSRRRQKRSR